MKKAIALFAGVFMLLAGIIFVYACLWQDGGLKDPSAVAVRAATRPH